MRARKPKSEAEVKANEPRAKGTGKTRSDAVEQALEAWRVHNDINLLLIDAIPEAGFAAIPSGSRGRDVARQLMHMHNVRVQWMQSSAKAEARELRLYGKEETLTREQLKDAFRQSGATVEAFLRRLLEDGNGRFFGGGPLRWMCYLISHESHHRGQIALALKQNGVRLPDKVALQGLWETWSKKQPAISS